MKLLSREEGRKKSACMAGLVAEERERLSKMTSVERMTAALRMGLRAPLDEVLRALAAG
jgi:hypothetical protein